MLKEAVVLAKAHAPCEHQKHNVIPAHPFLLSDNFTLASDHSHERVNHFGNHKDSIKVASPFHVQVKTKPGKEPSKRSS